MSYEPDKMILRSVFLSILGFNIIWFRNFNKKCINNYIILRNR